MLLSWITACHLWRNIMKIVVLAGGLSPERDVSLSSGSLIANALIENGHKVLLLDLYKGMPSDTSVSQCMPSDTEVSQCINNNGSTESSANGVSNNSTDDSNNSTANDLSDRQFDNLFLDSSCTEKYVYSVPKTEPDLEQLKRETNIGNVLIGKNVIKICQSADLVFIALHGDIGENGKLQAVFDSYDIRYTGTGYIGSLLAMDKGLSKQLMQSNNILTPDWKLYNIKNDCISDIIDDIWLPCVVKPLSCGSSIGVSIVYDIESLNNAIDAAKKYEDILLIEKLIVGREFSVGILNGTPLPPIEIIPNEGFYDYANKYQKGFAKEICPAKIPDDIFSYLQSTALKVHNMLKLSDYSRIDFILDTKNKAFCLEANTLPGMTPTSLLPQEALAIGITYNELCERIADMAMRHK